MLKSLKIILGKWLYLRFIWVVFSVVLAGFFEMIGVGLIPLFLLTITNPNQVIKLIDGMAFNSLLSGYLRIDSLVLFFSIGLIIVFFFKNLYLLFVIYYESKFLKEMGQSVATRIFSLYITRALDINIFENPATLIQSTTKEIDEFRSYLRHLVVICKEACILLFIFILLAYIDFGTVILAIFSLGGLGLFFHFFNRRVLTKKGLESQKFRSQIQKFLQESYSSVRLIRAYGAEAFFTAKFEVLQEKKEKSELSFRFISLLPKLFLEFSAVSLLAIVIIFNSLHGHNLISLIPIFTLLGVSIVRIMPAVNSLTASFSSARYFGVSVEPLRKLLSGRDDTFFLLESQKKYSLSITNNQLNTSQNILEIIDISYTYPGSKNPIISSLNLIVRKGAFITITGKSGSGKSTLLDLMIGLKEPKLGSIRALARPPLQASPYSGIGYVPQEFYLFDDTVKRNIAFGQPDCAINEDRVWRALTMAKLEKFIRGLSLGIESIIGDGGHTLSGGQRQRLALARALYFDPQLLIVDEGTSSLDSATELEVMESLRALKDITIIAVSHRKSHYEFSDRIYELVAGQLIPIK